MEEEKDPWSPVEEEEVEVSGTPVVIAATTSQERGHVLDDVAWPPRVLDNYSLTLIANSFREPRSHLTWEGHDGVTCVLRV